MRSIAVRSIAVRCPVNRKLHCRAWLLVALTLALSSALAQSQEAEGPPPGTPISGLIENWAYGEAVVHARPHTSRNDAAPAPEGAPRATGSWGYGAGFGAQPGAEGQGDSVAAGPVAEDGSFSLELPTALEAAALPLLAELVDDCLLVRPGDARGVFLTELTVERDETLFGFALQQTPDFAFEEGDAYLSYAYASEAVTVSGFCRDEHWTRGVDVVLEPGWNRLASRLERLSDGSLFFLERVAGVPEETAWRFVFSDEDYVGLGIVFVPTSGGVEVTEVIAGGPAERAGMRGGDIVLMLDGVSLRGVDAETFSGLARGPRGSAAQLDILRGGQNARLTVERDTVTLP